MVRKHVVEQGQCVSQVAKQYGFADAAIVADDAANAELTERRVDLDVMAPGDVLHVPETRKRSEPGNSEHRHRFRLKDVRCVVRVVVRTAAGQPFGDNAYELAVDGEAFTGVTDVSGCLRQGLTADAQSAELTVWLQHPGSGPRLSWRCALGWLDPVTTLSGVQQRLSNLGFYGGPINGSLDDSTRIAVRSFQYACRLPITGQIDGPTVERLLAEHGGV